MRQLSVLVDEPRALDAFAYRGFLFVLTFDGRVITYDVSQIADHLREEHGAAGHVVAYGLFSSKGIGASPEMKSDWQAYDHTSSTSLTVRCTPVLTSRFAVEASAHLDMRIYYNQLFLATDVGTFRAPLDATGLLTDDISDVERITGEPSVSLSTGMGAVAASMGEEGLAVFMDVGAKDRGSENRVEGRSVRSSIGWGRTLNHPTHDSYELLDSTVSEDPSGRKKLVRVAAPARDARAAVDMRGGGYSVWESGRHLVANAMGVSSLGRSAGVSRRRVLSALPDEGWPLWLGVTGNRCIVTESSERITVARGGQHVVIHEGPAVSVRTFAGSQRYRRLIAATIQGGILLSSVFVSDDEAE